MEKKTTKKPVVLACVNLKGGVGKTAIAVNFAAYCGKYKQKKTLLIDVDPQTNASFSTMGVDAWEQHSKEKGTIADLFDLKRYTSAEDRQRKLSDIVARNVFENVDVIPSHLDLFAIDLKLAEASGRERKLRKALCDAIKEYDIVVCDCPPNLTIATQNALALSTHFIVPVSPDFLSGVGVALLLSRIDEFCYNIEHDIQAVGVVISRYGRAARHRAETAEALREQFKDLVLQTVIKELVAVSEAAEQHIPVYDRGGQASELFKSLSEEILERIAVEKK